MSSMISLLLPVAIKIFMAFFDSKIKSKVKREEARKRFLDFIEGISGDLDYSAREKLKSNKSLEKLRKQREEYLNRGKDVSK